MIFNLVLNGQFHLTAFAGKKSWTAPFPFRSGAGKRIILLRSVAVCKSANQSRESNHEPHSYQSRPGGAAVSSVLPGLRGAVLRLKLGEMFALSSTPDGMEIALS